MILGVVIGTLANIGVIGSTTAFVFLGIFSGVVLWTVLPLWRRYGKETTFGQLLEHELKIVPVVWLSITIFAGLVSANSPMGRLSKCDPTVTFHVIPASHAP